MLPGIVIVADKGFLQVFFCEASPAVRKNKQVLLVLVSPCVLPEELLLSTRERGLTALAEALSRRSRGVGKGKIWPFIELLEVFGSKGRGRYC